MRYFSRRIGAAVCLITLTACQAQPGEAPIVEETVSPVSSPTSEKEKDARGKKTDFSSPYAKEIVIGVDDVDRNLNPHLIGSNSPVTDAIASLILPSAFRERSGTLVLNSDLLQEATLMAADSSPAEETPKTTTSAPSAADSENSPATHIRYTINPSAQWSDGTPISGTDFRYLWEEMRTQPGVSGSTGYQMIRDIEVSKAGRQVDVYFSRPYAPWKELFTNLLPSHIYRTESRDFADMMMENVAASGGNYALHKVDSGRGIVELIRNDRFYGDKQALTEKITFQRLSSDDAAAQMMRTGQIQMYYATPRAVSTQVMAQVPHTVVTKTTRPKDLVLSFNLNSESMASHSMREKISQSIDRDTVAEIVARVPGRDIPPFRSSSATRTPIPQSSESSSAQSVPPSPEEKKAPVVIAAPTTDNSAITAARTISDQLDRAGIPSRVDLMKPAELFGEKLPAGEVDMVVSWQNDSAQLSSLADQYRCSEGQKNQETPSSSTTPTATKQEVDPLSANITGFCDAGMTEVLNSALAGDLSSSEAQRIVYRKLEEESIVLPLLTADIFWAVKTDLHSPRSINVAEGNDGINGPFSDAIRWTYPPHREDSE